MNCHVRALYISACSNCLLHEKTFLINNFLRSLSVGYVHSAYFAKSEVKETTKAA